MTTPRRRYVSQRDFEQNGLRAKFDVVPGQLELMRFCEGHAGGALATHTVHFLTADPFYVCRSCAQDAADRGLTVRDLTEEKDA